MNSDSDDDRNSDSVTYIEMIYMIHGLIFEAKYFPYATGTLTE